jgi:hypothetical protein
MFGIPKYYGLTGNSLNLAISFIAGLDFFLFGVRILLYFQCHGETD